MRRTIDHYQVQEELTRQQQEEWDKASEEDKKEKLRIRDGLRNMCRTEGWKWLTQKYFPEEFATIDSDMENAIEEYRLHRGQGYIKCYNRMMTEIDGYLKLKDKEERDE